MITNVTPAECLKNFINYLASLNVSSSSVIAEMKDILRKVLKVPDVRLP